MKLLRSSLPLILLASFVVQPLRIVAQSDEVPPKPDGAYDSQLWLDDFHELLAAMASHYADLDWAIEDRHLDLPKLRADAEQGLRSATSDQAAEHIFEQFLNAFGDGHLSLKWPSAKAADPSSQSASLCSRLGFKTPGRKGIEFSLLPNFVTISGEGSNLFPGGLLDLHRSKVGVIRIANFNEHGFPDACENALGELHLDDKSACDHSCQIRVALRASNYLTAEVVKRANQLHTLGATALLIDITHNDGGDDWNEAVARSLTPVRLIEEHQGFLKVPFWTARLQDYLHSVESDISAGKQPQKVLTAAAERLKMAIAESEEPCDRSHVFDDGRLTCSLVGEEKLYWGGILPYAKPGSFSEWDSKPILFNPLKLSYHEGANRLPLFVAVDSHSWSSAERFAGLLQDNHAARVVGELTGGAGCGFVDGGIPTTLTHSHAQVKIPNCVGYLKDGSNANDGITPDIFVPWATRDTPYTRASKIAAVLGRKN
ncbi:S41 family peptidase [Silvibacterium sp.]|uniref:S41 family peptidase n=1 Tax=Silvibacterium sp. TaxID=1964179 RepID=UPI0039E3C057